MQRKNIKVGTEYLVSDRRDWQASVEYDRVEILDVSPWDSHRNWNNDPARDVTLTDGTVLPEVPGNLAKLMFAYPGKAAMLGRLIESSNRFNKPGRYVLVKPTEVKAEWAEGKALQDKAKAERAAARDAERIRREMREAHYADLSAQFTELFGFEPSGNREDRFSLSTSQMAEVLHLMRNK